MLFPPRITQLDVPMLLDLRSYVGLSHTERSISRGVTPIWRTSETRPHWCRVQQLRVARHSILYLVQRTVLCHGRFVGSRIHTQCRAHIGSTLKPAYTLDSGLFSGGNDTLSEQVLCTSMLLSLTELRPHRASRKLYALQV